MGQIANKSSIMGIIFGFGIVVAFVVVILIIGNKESKPSDIAQQSGKIIYDKTCVACHGTGVLNAPKIGNQADWEQRLLKGETVLLQNAINGFNTMPPRGGAFLTDGDLKLALQYMLSTVAEVDVETRPVAEVIEPPVVPVAQAPQIVKPDNGKAVYDRVCMACHTTGLLNAPKLGNQADWEQRLPKGETVLLQHAINGFNTMPPRGGNFVNDEHVKLAVQYMLASVQPEPIATPTPPPIEDIPEPPVEEETIEVVTQTVTEHLGKPIYDRVCMACHNTGVLNAPKLGNKEDWAARITKGEATLVQNSINGFNTMPPRGGNFISDSDMQLAVQYILASVGVSAPVAPIPNPVKLVEPIPSPAKSVKPVVPVISTPKPKEIPKTVVQSKPIEPKIQVVAPKIAEAPKIIPKVVAEPQAATLKPGEDIYNMTCKSCHIIGIAGAPKITEKAAWKQRIAKGEEVLIQNAITGINIMPPKGGNSNLTDAEVKLAVLHMLKLVNGK